MQGNVNIPDSTITSELTFRQLVLMNMQQLTNFPYIEKDFDALTDYELLCLVVKFLNDVIDNQNEQNDSITNMYNAFLELQTYVNNTKDTLETAFNNLDDYVRNYFDNLDVQEEINNKLDQMLEDGVLEQIIEQFLQSTAIWAFDTVSDLKAATNLTNGSFTKTLGYYNKNDNGGAIYKIRTKLENETGDDAFKIEIGSTLIAELIINDVIKVNSLGADSTGTDDSSSIIQLALDYINDRWTNDLYNINTIVFDGIYKVDNTIEMSPFARLTGDGYTTFITSANPVIWIHYPDGTIQASFPGTKIQYQYANLIDFPKGCLFKNNDGTKQNTCIEIGEHSDLTTTHNVARFKLCNFAIENYDIGLLYNAYNVYICNHERIHIENNNIAVKLGINTQSLVNAGEHILFDNCLIAGSSYGFLYGVNGFDIDVVNSSIDFNEYIVSDPYAKGYHKINFSNSHIEGNNHFLGTIGQHSFINIFNNKLFWTLDAENKNEFMTLADIASGISTTGISDNVCNLKNNDINIPRVGTTTNPEYITFNSYMNLLDIDNFYQSEVVKPQITNGNILKGVFDSIADGEVTISTDSTLNNGQLKVAYNGNFQATGQIVTDNYLYQGHKSLVLYKYGSATTNCSINIETSLLPLKKYQYIANCITYNNRTGAGIRFHYYDKDGNQLAQTDNYIYNPSVPSTTNTWYMTNYAKKITAPLNATYFKVTFYLGNWTNGNADAENTEYKIGGLIIN